MSVVHSLCSSGEVKKNGAVSALPHIFPWLEQGQLRVLLLLLLLLLLGTAVSQWLMCCAKNRKVAGSIPDGVIGIFH